MTDRSENQPHRRGAAISASVADGMTAAAPWPARWRRDPPTRGTHHDRRPSQPPQGTERSDARRAPDQGRPHRHAGVVVTR
jgi:hypothetical protein